MTGSLPRRALALVLEWATLHREELMEDWNLQYAQANRRHGRYSPWNNCSGSLESSFSSGFDGLLPESSLRRRDRGNGGLSGLITGKEAGVFATLRDPQLFSQVSLNLGTVVWPGELDLAPDAMYDAIKANGRWVLELGL
jgi:hypothetical protein